MMSRKHFNEIAKVLKETGASIATIEAIASFLKTQNPRFDYSRFVEACKQPKAA